MFSNLAARYIVPVFPIAIFAISPTAASTIHVPADYQTVQAAIDAASNGDTILVSDGTYVENIDFKAKSITLKSVNGPTTTIIDGSKLDTVVKFVSGEGLSSVLDGFTITNGNGLGIYILSSSPTIKNNLITANSGCPGAGINVGDGSPLIQNNTITNNAQTTCFGGTTGGGISVGGPPAGPQIVGNIITGNNATLGTGAGGVSLFAVGAVLIKNNFITNNIGVEGGGIGARSLTSNVQIIQNVIVGNTASEGGGIEIDNSVSLVLNNSIFGNNAPTGSALYAHFYTTTGAMTISNNLFIGNPGQPAVDCRGFDTVAPPVFSFNDVFTLGGPNYGSSCINQDGLNGNLSVDPLFVNPPSDLHLQSTSLVIDAGSNSAANLPTHDLASNDRILDGNGDCVATADMGAYEFARSATLTLSPAILSFDNQLVGSLSPPLSSTVTSSVNVSTHVCGISVTGDFAQTNTCGTAIAANGSCTLSVNFAPTARGTRSGLLQLITSDAGSPQSITLTGTGIAPVVSISNSSLNFSPQIVGTSSAPQPIELTNTGDGPLSISNLTLAGDFAETNTCGPTLAPFSTCSFSIVFAPTAAGNRTGSLSITDNAVGSPHSIAFAGTAIDFALATAPGNPTSTTVRNGDTAVFKLEVDAINGFEGEVSLTCTGVPSSAGQCSVSPVSVELTTAASTPFTLSVQTKHGAGAIPDLRQTLDVRVPLLTFLVLGVLPLLIRFRDTRSCQRFRYGVSLCLIFLAACLLSGCGGGGTNRPSTYTITVTGKSSGVARTLPLILTVTR